MNWCRLNQGSKGHWALFFVELQDSVMKVTAKGCAFSRSGPGANMARDFSCA